MVRVTECFGNQHTEGKWIVSGNLPRTQTVSEISGDRIHNVQSCSRPGSSRIPRLGGRANDPAFGTCVYWWTLHTFPTSIHCNFITRKAPRLLRARTAGSTRRDKTLPPYRDSKNASLLTHKLKKEKREEKGTEDKDDRRRRGWRTEAQQSSCLKWEQRGLRYHYLNFPQYLFLLQGELVDFVNKSCWQLYCMNILLFWRSICRGCSTIYLGGVCVELRSDRSK